MPRIPRGLQGQQIFHILSRGNGRATVFRDAVEYRNFIDLFGEAKDRAGVDIYAFALLPNHFHAVVRPRSDGALSRMMQWWLTSYVRRVHKRNDTSGHLWQGRFKSFAVQDDEHLLTVLRYVLLNPVRAKLSESAFSWRWSSLHYPSLIDPWPIAPPTSLSMWLREAIDEAEITRIRHCISRRSPFGSPEWQEEVARAGGIEITMRPRGRPPRNPGDAARSAARQLAGVETQADLVGGF